jgi:hypothetical protein
MARNPDDAAVKSLMGILEYNSPMTYNDINAMMNGAMPVNPDDEITGRVLANAYDIMKAHYDVESIITGEEAVVPASAPSQEQQQAKPASSKPSASSQPAAIPTPAMIAGQFGMPAIIDGVNDLLNLNGLFGVFDVNQDSIMSILNGCASEALLAMGRMADIGQLSAFIVDALTGEDDMSGRDVGLLLAAGNAEGSRAVQLKAVMKAGNYVYGVIDAPEEGKADKLGELYVPKKGIAAYMAGKGKDKDNKEKPGHIVVIKEVKDGMVSFLDNGEKKEASFEDFREMGFIGLLMMSRYAKDKNKETLSELTSGKEKAMELFEGDREFVSGKEYRAVRKLADLIINGVTEGKEAAKAVLYALNIWKNAPEMAGALGITLEEAKGDNGVDAIVQGYYKKVSAVLDAHEKGLLSPGEVTTEIKLLSTVRDMLITVNKSKDGRMEKLLNKAQLNEEDISVIMSSLIVSKAVNHSAMIKGLESVKLPESKVSEEEIINVERLKAMVEKKKTNMEKMKEVKDRFFASSANIEDVMPTLGSDTFVDIRGTMQSPMMARALAAAA